MTWVDSSNVALLTDLYELTMLRAYFEADMREPATFSLFARRLPESRNYLLACGVDDVLGYLEDLRFTPDHLDYLRSLGQFSPEFLAALGALRFTGDVRAVPEGTPVFPDEPILEVTAPIAEAQVVETFVMNQVHMQTVLASKASRIVAAAGGRPVIDFGPRRMHGADATIKAARAFHVAGVTATSNVLAGKLYGVPVSGTVAHSFIQAAPDEMTAFRAFVRTYPETVLLLDTYDTRQGARNVVALARELGADFRVRAVRIDSGDLAELAREVRGILDEAGLPHVQIIASGSLDEGRIAEILAGGAPVDGFGVGTKMGVSEDAPSLDVAYKLCEYAGAGRTKLSADKPILPGRKQVFRMEEGGTAVRDVIARADEDLPGRPLLRPVMRGGRRLDRQDADLEAARTYAAEELARLPEQVRRLEPCDPAYPVGLSEALRAEHARVRRAAGAR